MPNSQPMIPVKTYRFYFSTERPIRLPGFAGSAWRGAFGHALKKTVCVVRNTPCNQCLLKNACAYSVVFETPPPANAEKMRKYTAAPHPFVLQFPVTTSAANTIPDIFADSGIGLALPSGEACPELCRRSRDEGNPNNKIYDNLQPSYTLDVILFGHGQRYFPYLVHALQTAGKTGIGGHHQVFNLQKIDDINQQGSGETIYQNGELKPQQPAELPTIPAMPRQIDITFHTRCASSKTAKTWQCANSTSALCSATCSGVSP